MGQISSLAGIAACVALSLDLGAQPVLITAPTTVGPTDTTITPTAGGGPVPLATAAIVVRGTVLTVNGRHAIASMLVEAGAGLTHDAGATHDYSSGGTDVVHGLELTVARDFTVASGGSADLSARGYSSEAGPGRGSAGRCGSQGASSASGAGHGGRGAFSNGGCFRGGDTYGRYDGPVTFGSGGGSVASGGAGGGCLALVVSGTLRVDGRIVADGAAGRNTSSPGGGGAGGTVNLDAAAIVGRGSISADGGAGGDGTLADAGSGGGGRIRIAAATLAMTGSVHAVGGTNNRVGAAGTILLVRNGVSTLIVDNAGVSGDVTELPEAVVTDFMEVRGNARVGTPAEQALQLIIANDLTIEVGSEVQGDGAGLAAERGPGAGQGGRCGSNGSSTSSGGGHGGRGAFSNGGCYRGGATHGEFGSPTSFGSGGGNASSGGRGGGRVDVSVGGRARIDGTISARGADGANTSWPGGGGAGGSVRLTAGVVDGGGQVRADGGDGGDGTLAAAGSGGGGRVLIQCGSMPFVGRLSARGGSRNAPGGAGTILVVEAGARRLIVDNDGLDGDDTELLGRIAVDEFVVRGHAAVSTPLLQPLRVFVAQDLMIARGARVHADQRGYLADDGPAAGIYGRCGLTGVRAGSGGGHGGPGGGTNCWAGAQAYGDPVLPTTFGSGGGRVGASGVGGGLVQLFVGRILTVDGTVSANGRAGNGNCCSGGGGGAGGGVLISAAEVRGVGMIESNGGAGHRGSLTRSGDGAGGRVAVHTPQLSLPRASVRALYGGSSGVNGSVGTVHFGTSVVAGPPAGCEARNGVGSNPHIYRCVSPPLLGASWDSTIDISPATAATILAISARPHPGESTAFGELLVVFDDALISHTALGAHSIPVPDVPELLGLALFTQGIRIDTNGSAVLLRLLNAQDVFVGR